MFEDADTLAGLHIPDAHRPVSAARHHISTNSECYQGGGLWATATGNNDPTQQATPPLPRNSIFLNTAATIFVYTHPDNAPFVKEYDLDRLGVAAQGVTSQHCF